MQEDEKNTLCQSKILERAGWTKTALKHFGLEPVGVATNPVFKCASPMKLYSLKQVEEIEQLDEFVSWKERVSKRKESAKKSVATKAKKLLELVKSFKVQVKRRENTVLLAIDAYNTFHEQFEDYRFASTSSSKEFLDRITVNYIRHNLTSYEVGLGKIFGRTGKSTGYLLINQKIFQRIAEVYPEFAPEAQRQFETKFGVELWEVIMHD